MHRRLLSIALALVALAASGCIKVKHKTTVMPDGAGKVVLTMAMKSKLYAMAKVAANRERRKGDPPAPDPLYGELSESARSWNGADLAAAREACPNKLDFATLLPKVDDLLS